MSGSRFAVLVCLAVLCAGCADVDRRPSFLLVSIDTLRADRLSVYGNPRETSPRIDRLAARGVVFENAYSHSPKTAESHMSILTGVVPEVHRVENWKVRDGFHVNDTQLSPDLPLVAEILQAAGYRTAAYTGGSNVHEELGFGRGFEVYDQRREDYAGSFAGAAAHVERFAKESPEKPFFVFVHTLAVHDPYLPPARFRERLLSDDYAGRIVGDREALLAANGGRTDTLHEAFWERVDRSSEADRRRLSDLYDASIRHADELVGGLLDALERVGVADDTIVVLLADHGEEFGEHGAFLHNTLFDEILRVPLIVAVPAAMQKSSPRRRVASVVRGIDVTPTLLDWARLPIPPHVQGRSLRPLIEGSEEEPPRPLLAQWREVRDASLRAGRWKWIRTRRGGALFDIESDPAEQHDVADDHPAVATRLNRRLAAMLRDADSRALTFVPAQAPPLDAESRDALQALGYLEGGDN